MMTLRTLLFTLLLALCSTFASAQTYVAYQAIPGTNTGWPDIARLDYTARERLSEAVQRDILPGVVKALGLQAMALETQIVPGGFTAFGCEMLFINLRDDKGAPYSGLDDVAFAAALAKATQGFAPSATIAGRFRSRTALIGEGWPDNRGGALYIERLTALPVDAIAPLDLLSYRFGDLLRGSVR